MSTALERREWPADRLDRYLPEAEVRERHEVLIHAPAAVVFDVARRLEIRSLPLVQAIFWLRGKILGSRECVAPSRGLVEETLGLGWGILEEEQGRFFAAGASCQPWLADPVFTAISPGRFAAYAEPGRVKIAWTLEAEPLGPGITRFATETRAAGTDARARAKFRRYWRRFGLGVRLIRRLMLSALRRQAERRWQGAPARLCV